MAKKKNLKTSHSELVLSEKLQGHAGELGIITLNNEKLLNSLNLEMVSAIRSILTDWEEDEQVKAILIRGAGDRAFCAGGDVQALYRSSISLNDGVAKEAEAFFKEEYCLDYTIHTYDKPIICIGHGIVMGGGLGLLAGASHRVVTESTSIAMPEITIGLFPDVGGTYFLNSVPYNLGYFLALTGAKINAEDALFCQLADYAMLDEMRDTLPATLAAMDWSDNLEDNHSIVSECLRQCSPEKHALPKPNIKSNLQTLENACQHNSLCHIVKSIKGFDEDNKYLRLAKETMLNGSPLSLVLIYEQLKRHRHIDLQGCFQSELLLATNIVRHTEFAEGVRALLIDKDKSPNWQYKHFSHIPNSVIEKMFEAPWQTNPLSDLLA